MRYLIGIQGVILAFFSLVFGFCETVTAVPVHSDPPKNIIIMISDGCGYNHILATNYYEHGRAATQPFESFPVRLGMSTYPLKLSDTGKIIEPGQGYIPDSAWSGFSWVEKGWTDSAPAASSMACGKKTYNGAIGVDADHKPMYSITQRAKEIKKAAGVVTTVPLSHATPAGFSAHNPNRNNYLQIALEMILDSKLDVIMGCGHPGFDNDGNSINTNPDYKYVGGKACWDSLLTGAILFSEAALSGNKKVQDIDGDGSEDPWTLIHRRADFQRLKTQKTPKRVLGIPEVRYTLQQLRKGKTDTLPFTVPLTATLPDLSEMTLAALNILDNDPDGFFLMVEGGAVDWANHDNQPARMIEEQVDFHKAVRSVIQWIESNGGWEQNLLVVTADHECGYLTGPLPKDNSPVTNPIVNKGKGKLPEMKYNSMEHTNQLVPFYAKGAGSAMFMQRAVQKDSVRGPYIDNTDVANTFFRLWPAR
ncbi:MAG: alkaline phosphatase [Bacteroidales bacterium]